MSCNKHNNCTDKKKCGLKYPTDDKSLYSSKIYDNQTVNRRCYEDDPIDIVEGFGCSSRSIIFMIIKWVIIGLLIYLIGTFVYNRMSKEEITLNVDSVEAVGGGVSDFFENFLA